MARIAPPAAPGLLARLAYWMSRKKVGQVAVPLQIHAHHGRLLRGLGHMELAQEAARLVPKPLKSLASLRVAYLVGCPF